MKIVVIGGTGLIGSQVVTKLGEHGHEAIAASPDTGVNTLTGEGLPEVLAGRRRGHRRLQLALVRGRGGARVLPDVDRQPARGGEGGRRGAPRGALGRRHRADGRKGYFKAKSVQEQLIADSGIPYSIVHATQFFEFIKSIAALATDGDRVRFPPVLFQPMASEDVAKAVGRTAVGAPVNRIVEVPARRSSGWTSSSSKPWRYHLCVHAEKD